MQQQKGLTHLQQHLDLVSVAQQPLRLGHSPQTPILLVSYQCKGPSVGSLFHHVVGIYRLHKRIGCQLQSISVVQLLQEGRVRALVSLNADAATFIEASLTDSLEVPSREVVEDRVAHFKKLLFYGVLVDRETVLFVVVV